MSKRLKVTILFEEKARSDPLAKERNEKVANKDGDTSERRLTLEITIPKTWRHGPVERLKTFFETHVRVARCCYCCCRRRRCHDDDRIKLFAIDGYQVCKKFPDIQKTARYLANETTGRALPDGARIASWVSNKDVLRLVRGEAPILTPPSTSLTSSYEKWSKVESAAAVRASYEDDEDLADLAELDTEKERQETVKRECTTEIVRWTERAEKLRNALKRQWNEPGRDGKLPFPLLVKNTWSSADEKERSLFLSRSKELFLRGHLLKFQDIPRQQDAMAVLGAVADDPDRYATNEDDSSPVYDLLETVVRSAENDDEHRPDDRLRDFIRRQKIPSQAVAGTPKRLSIHPDHDRLVVEWLLALRSLFVVQLACCFASLLTYPVRERKGD